MTSYQYRKSHCGDKTILRPSYLHNGISYTGKMSSLYWIRALFISNDYKVLVVSFPPWIGFVSAVAVLLNTEIIYFSYESAGETAKISGNKVWILISWHSADTPCRIYLNSKVLCQKQITRAGTNDYILEYLYKLPVYTLDAYLCHNTSQV